MIAWLVLVGLLVASPAWATTWYVKAAGPSTTGPADSCENKAGQLYVQAAINAAVAVPTTTFANMNTVQMAGGTCEWTQTVQIPVGANLKLLGAGKDVTRIARGVGKFLTVTTGGTAGSGGTGGGTNDDCHELGNLTFQPGTVTADFGLSGLTVVQGYSNCVYWHDIHWNDPTNIDKANKLFQFVDVYGVVTRFQSEDIHFGGAGGAFIFTVQHESRYGGFEGAGAWAHPSNFGSAEFMVFEDSLIVYNATPNGASGASGIVLDGDRGSRVVVRYSDMKDGGVTLHGTESGGAGWRGLRAWEGYGNRFTTPVLTAQSRAFNMRGGTGLIHHNSNINAGAMLQLTHNRETDNIPYWGRCDDTGPYDVNSGIIYDSGTAQTGTTTDFIQAEPSKNFPTATNAIGQPGYVGYMLRILRGSPPVPFKSSRITSNTATTINTAATAFPNPPSNSNFHTWLPDDTYQIRRPIMCLDEPGTGKTNFIVGATINDQPLPIAPPDQDDEPVYVWGNTVSGASTSTVSLGGNEFLKWRPAYYAYTGTSRDGLRQNRPGGLSGPCTSGEAWWSTDQGGNWEDWAASTHTVGTPVSPSATNDGVLDKCVNGAWVNQYYKPLAYPHYLSSGAPPPPDPPSAPTGFEIVP